MATVPESGAAPVVAPAPRAGEVRWPLVWLAGILVVGLALRWLAFREPLQLDEFPALYAVAERHTDTPDMTPAARAPLVPVASWQDVHQRSVLPYGIVHPLPLYHYLLYGLVQVLSITEWSLRLPSLLAGLACVAGVYFLCRWLLGSEAALVAALLAAVDPIQIAVSDLARPYAVANLVCILSFAALLGMIHLGGLLRRTLCLLGYAVALACLGYLNPLLLMVAVAHLGVVGYACWASPAPGASRWMAAFWWLGGLVLGGVLLVPLVGYIGTVSGFALQHRDFLLLLGDLRLLTFFAHNSTFLIALLIVSLAGYAVQQIHQQEKSPEKSEAPASAPQTNGHAAETPAEKEAPATPPVAPAPELPLPESPELLWLARAWFFWPQFVVLVLAFGLGLPIYLSSSLSYTTLGGVILLAYWATRERARDIRLGITLAVVVTVGLWGLLSVSRGVGLLSPVPAQVTMQQIDELEKKGSWRANDVLLVRGTSLEADLLPDGLPSATRAQVTGVLLAPYTTLYVSQKPRPIILLSKSQFRSPTMHTEAGEKYDTKRLYNEALAARLRKYDQYWLVTGDDPDRKEFFGCVLPWLADAVGWDLYVARNRQPRERYFDVSTGSAPSDYLEGLTNAEKTDFTSRSDLVRVQKRRPPWAYRLGALGGPGGALHPASLAVLGWRLGQEVTPRLTQPPDDDSPADTKQP
jgi:hypothetical protein